MGFSKTLIAIALLPLAAQAADTSSNTDEHLVVLGRQPQNIDSIAADVTVISQTDIEKSGAQSLEDLLRGRAGIQVSNSGSGPVLSLRGFSADEAANNVLVLIDGRRLNGPSLSAPSLAGVQLSSIQRIEILSGSAGVLYGDQAVGGVVNIITKSGTDQGQISATAGSNSHKNLAGSFSKGFANGFYVDGNAAWDDNDNYRDHAKSITKSADGRVGYQNDNTQAFAEASVNSDDRQQPGPLYVSQTNPKTSRSEFANNYINEVTRVGRFGVNTRLNDHWQFLVDGSASKRTRDTDLSYIGYSGDYLYHAEERFNRVSPRVKASFGDWQWLGGIDYAHSDYTDTSVGADNKRDNKAAYGSGQWQQGALSVTAGLRYTKVDDDLVYSGTYDDGVHIDHNATTWSLASQYQLGPGRAYVRVDRNVRFAKLDEQGYTSAGVIGLKPQTGYSYEAGWQQSGVKVSVFRLDLKNEIVYDDNAPAPTNGYFAGANVNADKSRRYGANLNLSHRFAAVTLGVDYQYLDAKFTGGDSDGKQVPWVSKNSGSAYAEVALPHALSSRLSYQYRGSQYLSSDTLNSDPKQGGYGLWNWSGQWQQGPWQLVLRADNLFDKHYADYGVYNAYGENYWYPGNGREVNLTARYSF
ncbi:TonB-dependent receptor [Gallaecimonas mangrovi]|uniref:TonB-dependent receptor n=1 Tax=Gallaecimonas mangrovi TaxID=2291597 RepID=UPI001868F287|nr:TonB-dependent receptor [Gallaecimonas mangrovi]